MSGYQNKEITYKVFNKSSKKEDLRCFSLPRISSLKQLEETIRNICKPKKISGFTGKIISIPIKYPSNVMKN